jgi:hypothetical protein
VTQDLLCLKVVVGNICEVLVIFGRIGIDEVGVARPKRSESYDIVDGLEIVIKTAMELRGHMTCPRMEDQGD